MALTEKQIKFCELSANGKSAKEAYMIAYGKDNEHVAKVSGCRLLQRAEIAEEVKRLKERNNEIVEVAQTRVMKTMVLPDIASAAERMGILTEILRGKVFFTQQMLTKDGGVVDIEVPPSYRDRIAAAVELNKMTGDNAPQKIEVSEGTKVIYPKRKE